MNRRMACLVALVVLALWAGGAVAQEILLDENIKAGKLLCFRDFKDPKKYYYLADKADIARKDNGKPQFAFIKYVQNVSEGGEGGITTGKGGGLVHFLVSYEVPEQMRREAEQELGRLAPGAQLVGPVIYRSGNYLVSSPFEGEEDAPGDQIKMVNNIHGVGKAPLLEGHKCAVSMNLTKEGSTVLWESFAMPTSLVSVTFDMEIKGYRNPFEATITADWSQISKSHQLQAGVKAAWFGADIDVLFRDLVKKGAIKIEQKGEDANMEKIIAEAQRLLMQQIFDREDMPNMAALTGGAGGNSYSNLDRAVQFMRDDERRRNSRSSGSREGRSNANHVPEEFWVEVMSSPSEEPIMLAMNGEPTGELFASEDGDDSGDTGGTGDTEDTGDAGGSGGAGRGELRTSPLLGGGSDAGTRRARSEDLRRPGERSPAAERRDALRSPYEDTERDGEARGDGAEREEEEHTSGISMIASYKMRRIKVTGKTVISLKKYTLDSQAFPFTENIGGLRRYMDDPGVFQAVNLDDPVFKQREVLVALDGQDSEDFTKFINYVTVQIRKKHGSGQETNDEIKIDRTNFNESANNFRMVYGWKGDTNRAQWLEYEYRVRWSFFGGATYEQPWQTTDDFMITVAPPTQHRTLRLEADPEELTDQKVRHVEATIRYTLFGTPFAKKVTLRARDEAPEQEIEYVHATGDYDYEYELAWRLRGRKTVKEGPLKADETVIYCDELPEK